MKRIDQLALALGAAVCAISIAVACSNGTDEPAGMDASTECAPDGLMEYCYPGPPANRGIGVCADEGTRKCTAGRWSDCEGYTLPSREQCGDSLDNDCNGVAEEGCPCANAASRPCYQGSASTRGIGVCVDGTQTCTDGTWGSECVGQTLPTIELCNELDDDCNGVLDEGCMCTNGTSRPCYSGPAGTHDVPPCHGGTQYCLDGFWAVTCADETTPQPEMCNSSDDDCDEAIDEELGTTSCGQGVCTRTVDNCVGGETQVCEPLCDGVSCVAGSECSSGFCKDGRCCDAACTSPCQECSTGTCQPVHDGYDDPECTGANSCNALGECKKVNGQSCSSDDVCLSGHCKDGKCCNMVCTGLCRECSTGTCQDVLSADDPPECTDTRTCNALGECKKLNGQSCTTAGECLSNHCKDGKCCDLGCTGLCRECSTGTCQDVLSADDPPECTDTRSCNALGECKLVNGQSCTSDGACLSGHCKDGKCCDLVCTGLCRECSTGTCQDVLSADDPPECTDTRTCNALGQCKKKSGQSCTVGTECLSGVCSCNPTCVCT